MSRLFSAVRFGAFIAWFSLLTGLLMPNQSAFAQNVPLAVQTVVAQVTLHYGAPISAFMPVEASGGMQPYAFAMVNPLPDGLQLDPTTGIVSGTATALAAAANYTIKITDADGASAEAQFSLEIIKSQPVLLLTVMQSSVFPGATITLTADLQAPSATGKITFSEVGSGKILGTLTMTDGTAVLTSTNFAVGTTTVQAIYSGDQNFETAKQTAQVTIQKATAAVTLTSDKATVGVGETVTLTAKVTPDTVTGGITFRDGGADVRTVNILNGTAQVTLTISAGAHSFTATFAGNDLYEANTSSAVDVQGSNGLLTPTVELLVDKQQANVGDMLTFTTTIKVGTIVQTTAFGSVSLKEGAKVVGNAQVTRGVATISLNALIEGTHTLLVTYSGDDTHFAGDSGNITVTILPNGKVNTTVQVTASKAQIQPGESLIFTASITPGIAIGDIQLVDEANGQAGVIKATKTLAGGQASFTVNDLVAGTHRIYVNYVPQGNYNASTSAPLAITVGNATTAGTTASTTTLTVSKSTLAYGEQVTLTANVVPANATGLVTFKDGVTVIGTGLLANGVAAITTSKLDSGTHTITASYAGSTVYAASVAAATTVTVDRAMPIIQLVPYPRSPSVGQAYELRVTISPTTATGKVTFSENGTQLGDATIAGGVAVWRITKAILGDHLYSASYAGDTKLQAVTTPEVTVSVTTAKPSPLNDPSARAMVSSQVSAATRMANAHVGMLQLRLETLHEEDVPAFSNGIHFSQGGTLPSAARAYEDDPWVRNSGSSPAGRSIDHVMRNDRLIPIDDKKELTLPKLTAPTLFNMWTAGSVTFGGTNYTGLGSASRTSFTIAGLTAGIDAKVADGLRVGFAASYSSESAELGGGGGDLKTTMAAASLYSSWRMNQNVFIDATFGYGFANFNAQRMDSNLLVKLPGQRRGQMIIASLGASYDEKIGRLKVAPYARMDIAAISLGSYSEQGDADWALNYQSMHTTAQALVLGARAQQDFEQTWGILSPFGRVEYRHALSSVGVQSLAYAGDPTTSYMLSTASSGSDTMSASLGVKAADRKLLAGSLEYSLSGGQGGLVGQGLRGAMRLGF